MKSLFALITTVIVAASAQASNKYSFVNTRYIDETTPWSTILRTTGYQARIPALQTAGGSLVSVMGVCGKSGHLYAPVAHPIFGSGSEAGVVGTKWENEMLPAYASHTVCVDNSRGAEGNPCEMTHTSKTLQTGTSFQIPVMAIQSVGDQGSIVQYWGVAFTKSFTIPACR